MNSSFNSLSNTKPSVHPYKFFTLLHSTILRQKLKLKSKERTENFIENIPNDLSHKTTVTEQIIATWCINDYLFDHGGDTTMADGEDREKTMKQNITC